MKKKFLIFDLDWTLYNPETQALFKWVPELIKHLSQWYTMFVSTRSSDEKAKEILKQWNIYDYFEAVMWSTTMEKSEKHVEVFAMVSESNSFRQKCIFIGDWDIDRYVAEESWLPFIKIWKEGKDYAEVDSILEIESVFKKAR